MRDEQFLKKFSETYSAGFRFHPVLREYLRSHFDVMIAKADTIYLNVRCGDINSPELRSFLSR
jgi:hypothetical protein